MSDKLKFHKMTKPIKFRKFKLFLKSVGHTYEVGIYKINYLFNNLLFKLNILKRYSYRDMVQNFYPAPPCIKFQTIEAKNFRGKVVMQLVQRANFDIDYFYYKKKDGTKKITLQLKDVQEYRLFAEAHLEDISICVDNRWYQVNHLPQFKVATTLVRPTMKFNVNEALEPLEYTTVTYDVASIKALMYSYFIGCEESPQKVSDEEMKQVYEAICREFKDKLNTITLQDIMR